MSPACRLAGFAAQLLGSVGLPIPVPELHHVLVRGTQSLTGRPPPTSTEELSLYPPEAPLNLSTINTKGNEEKAVMG